MNYLKDERFSSLTSDPKFKRVPKSERKVKIDKRFHSMFTDKHFQLNYCFDKKGRRVFESQNENFRKYYDLSSDDENEFKEDQQETVYEQKVEVEGYAKKPTLIADENIGEGDIHIKAYETLNDEEFKEHLMIQTVQNNVIHENDIEKMHTINVSEKLQDRLQDMTLDYARGIGIFQSDSSSDESTSEDSEDDIIHDWGERDKDALLTDEITNRLAICNMDWDRISSTDLMVLFNSFLPPEGFIENITIYPSEFGQQRMKEEEVLGPKELIEDCNLPELEKNEEEEDSEGQKYQMEKLREYQLKRMKYFYAVIICDSKETASTLYSECDELEYESSSTKIDLRFIPDDMIFDQEPKEVCSGMPEPGKYKPSLFCNTALQQGKVNLTWDETDPKRRDLTKKLNLGEEVEDEELKAYIAISSEDSSENDCGDDTGIYDNEENSKVTGESDRLKKYRSLLANFCEEKKHKEDDVELEISWDVGLKEKTQSLVNEKLRSKMSHFEKILEQKKERRKQKSNQLDPKDEDDLISDEEYSSDLCSSDNERLKRRKKKNPKKKVELDPLEQKQKAELELLLADNDEGSGKKHFSLKSIQESEKGGKKKNWKKPQIKSDEIEDNFNLDVTDKRFSALFTSHHYNIDPTDPHFKKTKAMEELISEKQKRKHSNLQTKFNSLPSKKLKPSEQQLDPELRRLVNSVKMNVKPRS